MEATARTIKLKPEFDYFLKHQDELVRDFAGKFVVIKNERILGYYDDLVTAINVTAKTEQMGTFLVQLVTAGEDAYTIRFHSRVKIP